MKLHQQIGGVYEDKHLIYYLHLIEKRVRLLLMYELNSIRKQYV